MEQPPRVVIGIAGPMGAGKSYAADLLAEKYRSMGRTAEVIPFARPLKAIAGHLACLAGFDPHSDEAKNAVIETVPYRYSWIPPCVETLTGAAYDPNRLDPVFGMEQRYMYARMVEAFDRIFVRRDGCWRFRENEAGVTFGRLLQLLGTEGMRGSFGEDVFVKAARAALERATADVLIFPDVRFENEAAFVREAGKLIHIQPAFAIELGDGRKETHASEAGVGSAVGDITVWNHGDEWFAAAIFAAAKVEK